MPACLARTLSDEDTPGGTHLAVAPGQWCQRTGPIRTVMPGGSPSSVDIVNTGS